MTDDEIKPPEHEIRFLGEMQKLEWKPGDIGVIKYPHRLSLDAIDRIRADWERSMGSLAESHRLLILTEGMEFGVISNG
jgi:hypothetical protein